MSLSANIDHLAIAAGIEAVVVETATREYRGDQKWHRVLDGALELFHRTDEKSIRLVVGKHTIVVQKEGEETVAVVLPTGHAIAKSLRRMIRRMARKDRGPLPKEMLQGAADQAPQPEQSGAQPSAQPGQPQPGRPQAPAMSPGVTTPSPSPMSAPTPTPTSGQPSTAQPKEEAKPEREHEAGERGGFRNF